MARVNTGTAWTPTVAADLDVTAIQTGNYPANPNEFVLFDTTAAARTLTLPTAPPNGTQVGARIVTFGTGNGVNVNCAGTDVLDKPGGATSQTSALVYNNNSIIYLYDSGVWTRLSSYYPLSSLDTRYVNETDVVSLAAGQDLELSAVVGGIQTVQTTTLTHNQLTKLRVEAVSDDTVNNTNSVRDDAELFLALAAATNYHVTAIIYYDAVLATEFRVAFSYSGTGTFAWTTAPALHTSATFTSGVILSGAPNTLATVQQVGGVSTTANGAGPFASARVEGIMKCTTAGTLRYKFAQGTPVAENTIRKAGSWMLAEWLP